MVKEVSKNKKGYGVLEVFIANRLSREHLKGKNRVMVSVATISVAISVAVMVVALSVIVGFKEQITQKVTGFNSHITISNLDNNRSYSSVPIEKNQPYIDDIRNIEGVLSVNGYSIKAGVVENGEVLEGIVLKGVDSGFDTTFLAASLIEGELVDFKSEQREKKVVISSTLANLLKLKVGDKARMMFIDEPPRRDVFIVSGIYNTSLAEFDRIMIFTDIRNVNRLCGWSDDSLSGFEVRINNIKDLFLIKESVEDVVFDSDDVVDNLIIEDVTEKNGAIFDWLDLQDLNVVVISFIMLFVAGFNMVSMMLILLLEKRSMIGVLKTLGAKDAVIQRIFIYRSLYVIIKGVLCGVVIGVGLCLIQKYFGIIKLSESAYFMTEVPIVLDLVNIALVACCSVVAVVIIQIIPTFIVSKISPDQNVGYK